MEEFQGRPIWVIEAGEDAEPRQVRTHDEQLVMFSDESSDWIAYMIEHFPSANYFVG